MNTPLNVDMITKEAISLFRNSNLFLAKMDSQHDEQFGIDNAKIGTTLSIRLPSDFVVTDSGLFVPETPAIIGFKETVVLGTAAVLIANPVVSRRFWAVWIK